MKFSLNFKHQTRRKFTVCKYYIIKKVNILFSCLVIDKELRTKNENV